MLGKVDGHLIVKEHVRLSIIQNVIVWKRKIQVTKLQLLERLQVTSANNVEENWGEGTLYIEICPDCKVVSIQHQQT